MKRGAFAAATAFLVATLAIATVALWRCNSRPPAGGPSATTETPKPPDEATRKRLDEIPIYRAFIRSKALRSGSIDPNGTLHVEIDLRAILEPRLAAMGFAGASDLFPRFARGTIAIGRSDGTGADGAVTESWRFDGPATLFDLLDRNPDGQLATHALDSIPGAPTAMVRFRLAPARLADPLLGGTTLAAWRDRADFAERLVGRSLRAELSQDLAGPAVFALYEGTDDTEAEAVFAAELKRSDRLISLLDMAFGLGALTERATVRRYRGVPTGSFAASLGGPGLALAVDGPVLFIATSRARLESAIDARRATTHPRGAVAAAGEPGASWNAVAASPFVSHGWARLARLPDDRTSAPLATTTASLWAEGSSGWRLEGRGPAPAITADPVVPFLRSVLAGRQRGAD